MGLFLHRLLLAAWMILSAGLLHAQDLQPVPPLSDRVVDRTRSLTPLQREALSVKLATVERQYGTQLVVLLVETTQPEDIAAYAQRVGDAWKIGRRQVGDGLLIVVAKKDRKIRIEVAKSLEGAVPDLAASRIISDQLAPAFKAGDYAGGLNAAVDSLVRRIGAEGLPLPATVDPSWNAEGPVPPPAPAPGPPSPSPAPASDDGPGIGAWAIFLFFGVPIAGAVFTSMLGRKLGALGTGGLVGGLGFWLTSSAIAAGVAGLVALILVGVFGIGSRRGGSSSILSSLGDAVLHGAGSALSGGWSSGGSWSSGGGSSSGGGFSSGGGGDFGGGGASGDW